MKHTILYKHGSSLGPAKINVRRPFLHFLLLGLAYLNTTAVLLAQPVSQPAPGAVLRLKNGFFPPYLSGAWSSYLKTGPDSCFKALEQLQVTPYSAEPEKYYLLKALCAPKEKQPLAAQEYAVLAFKEKGSSSDILYAASLIFTQIEANDDALKRYQEAIWFNSFKQFSQKDFYFDLGALQYKLAALGEAKISLEKSQELGTSGKEIVFLLADIAIAGSERKNAILGARKLRGLATDALYHETLLRALMVSADPVFNKREIIEASVLAKSIADKSLLSADIGVAATKALLLVNEIEQAESKLHVSLAANPTEPRLLALDLQIKEEKTRELGQN